MILAKAHSRWTQVFKAFLGALFLWAAISKLGNPRDFLGSLYAYELPLPRILLQFAAVILPWVELLAGLLLLCGARTETGLWVAILLLSVFAVAAGQAWMRGLSISCGCFNLGLLGVNSPAIVSWIESPAMAATRNIVLVVVAGWLLRR